MGYLRDKYGDPDVRTESDSKWLKLKDGQTYKGTVDGFEMGRYGTEVLFTDGKRITLNLAVLTREVIRADPDRGDVLEITCLGDEPGTGGDGKNPTKLFRVTKTGGNGAAPAVPAAPVDVNEPF